MLLAAPSSTDGRLGRAAQSSRGCVYAVSTMGITGTRDDVDVAAKALVERLYRNGAREVCVVWEFPHPLRFETWSRLLMGPLSAPPSCGLSPMGELTVLPPWWASFKQARCDPSRVQERHK